MNLAHEYQIELARYAAKGETEMAKNIIRRMIEFHSEAGNTSLALYLNDALEEGETE